MPQIFKFGAYRIQFWSNENDPLEPIHVHVSEGRPTKNSTKVWITGSGHSLLCNNNSKIPKDDLKKILRMIEANSNEIMEKWYDMFGEINYYC